MLFYACSTTQATSYVVLRGFPEHSHARGGSYLLSGFLLVSFSHSGHLESIKSIGYCRKVYYIVYKCTSLFPYLVVFIEIRRSSAVIEVNFRLF